MRLVAGTLIGPYEIISAIGHGGMGEVYRARDTRLKREVALKVLPVAIGADTDRIARLQREAELLAALNHPNIAQIHGLEALPGASAIVMELVEGEDLAVRITSGMRITEALSIARQIADALDAAHERGIVHRDLKPSNVRIRDDGTVKVLDFGLAKVLEPLAVTTGISQPTITSPAITTPGTILGTAAYMSPEQARGKPVDQRADVWAFGCVLFEMLSARRPFDGETVSDAIAAIIEREPDWRALPAQTPGAIRRLLKRCLEKDPHRRLRDMAHAAMELADVLTPGTDADGETVAAARLPTRTVRMLVAAVFVSLSIGAWIGSRFLLRSPPADLQPLARLNLNLGRTVTADSPLGGSVILSPDGQRVVLVANDRLFSRRVDRGDVTEIAGTAGAHSPFFSPDGQSVAFFSRGKLKRVPLDGGEVLTLCDANSGRGGTWGEDGFLIVALSGAEALSRVPASGGKPEPFTTLAPGEFTHRWPQLLPGGKALLYTSHTAPFGFNRAVVVLLSLPDRKSTVLHRGGSFGRFFAGRDGAGFFSYVNHGTLYAAPFDPVRLQMLGTPAPMLERVAFSWSYGGADLDVARNGSLIYRHDPGVTVQWIEPSGKTTPLIDESGEFRAPALDPQDERLAVVRDGDLWVFHLARGTRDRLTFDGEAAFPTWTPDGRYLILGSATGLSWTRPDGGSRPEPLIQSDYAQLPYSVSADGRRLVFSEFRPDAGRAWDIIFLPLVIDGSGVRAGTPMAFLATRFDEREPALSSDGRWLAYSSNESGNFQVYVRSLADSSRKWLISSGGGHRPRWSRSNLYFINSRDQLVSVGTREAAGALITDPPRLWSETRVSSAGSPTFSLAADALRGVALLPPDAAVGENGVVFMVNALDEFRRRLSGGR